MSVDDRAASFARRWNTEAPGASTPRVFGAGRGRLEHELFRGEAAANPGGELAPDLSFCEISAS